MKTLTVRLPEPLVADIEAESRGRKISKSDVVRERLQLGAGSTRRQPAPLDAIADLIGSVDGLPTDLSARKKRYLLASGYGRKRAPQCPSLPFFDTIEANGCRSQSTGCAMGMNVNLTPQLEEMVRQKVNSGLYTSASEVVREALRLMDEKDRLQTAKLAQLRQDIREGLDSGPATTWDAEQVKREGRARRVPKGRTA